jgi:hypothetical protein
VDIDDHIKVSTSFPEDIVFGLIIEENAILVIDLSVIMVVSVCQM